MSKIVKRIDGLLLVDKPLTQSSSNVVQMVKRLFQAKKAGHTGSLDPLATGMLPICFGEAAKFSQFMLDADKGYTATGKLGEITATQDAEGEVLAVKAVEHITEAMLLDTLQKFTGPIEQVPSMYSALKQNGVPLYKLARQGITVERKARSIIIHQLTLESFNLPYFTIKVRCSKGTYIRNLVEDIGNHLAVGAFVSKLHRDFSCPFEHQPMTSLEALESSDMSEALLHPISSMVSHLPVRNISPSQKELLYYGISIEVEDEVEPNQLYQLINEAEQFVGLGQFEETNRLKSKRLVQQ
jgi:tRNA pseudouridine55 synthase